MPLFTRYVGDITVAEIWQSYFFQKIAFLFEIAILFCKITFFLWNPDFFIVNLIFSFSRSRIPSFTTRSSFTYNLVFLFHAGNEFNVVWIRPVATRRLRSDHGLIAMVTSWPRLFISLAWHVMSLLCPYWYTRFSFYKNILYKNIEAEILWKYFPKMKKEKSLIKLIYSTWSARSRQSF